MEWISHASGRNEIEQQSIVVLYDHRTGIISHIHRCVTSYGGQHPDKALLEREAREFASEGEGGITKNLGVLHVDPDILKEDKEFKVDVTNGALIEVNRRLKK